MDHSHVTPYWKTSAIQFMLDSPSGCDCSSRLAKSSVIEVGISSNLPSKSILDSRPARKWPTHPLKQMYCKMELPAIPICSTKLSVRGGDFGFQCSLVAVESRCCCSRVMPVILGMWDRAISEKNGKYFGLQPSN